MENIAKLHADEPDSYLYANNVYVDDGQNPQQEPASAEGETAKQQEQPEKEPDLPDFLRDLSEDEIIKIE